MEQCIELMAEICEVEDDQISMNTNFRDEIEDFSSLMGFSIIVMIEDEYDKVMSVPKFKECKTIGDLYEFAIA